MSSLLRSTKFVRYFSGAARTLILNSAKTAEATAFNQKSLCAINNVLMREYATSKKTENLEPLLQRLDSEVKRYGRISKKDIDEVFDEIKAKHDITSSQSLLVIRCCGELVPEELPEQRTLLVQKIWSVLTERGIPMDISHYNALLRVYIENEHSFSPAKFLEELENKGLQPNRVTYQRLMWRYCQEGDVDGATKVLEKMRELSMPVSEPVLNALVMGHAFHGDTEGAKAVLETMAGAGLQPTNHTYKLLACGYARKGDIEGVESVIKISTEKDAYLADKDILEVIEHLVDGGHSDKIDSLFSHLQKGFGYNQDVMNLILRLLNKGHEDSAKKVMKTMPKSANVEDTIFKGAFFVKQLLRLDRPAESVIKTCKELKAENLVPNALFIATECALQLGRAELAQKLFKELRQDGTEIRQHYYWPLLAQKSKERDEEGLLQLLRDMHNEGLAPTGEALRDYVIPFLLTNDKPQNVIVKLQIANVPVIISARNVMIEMLEKGNMKEATEIATQYFIRGQFSLLARPLLNAFAKTKDINSLVAILHVACSKMPLQADVESSNDDATEENSNSSELGRIIKTSVKILNNSAMCKDLLKALHDKGLSISTEYAQQIEQYLDKNMTTEISELLTKLASSDLEMVPVEVTKRGLLQQRTSAQLERLIEQNKAKGESPNLNRFYKQLLEMYVKEKNVEKLKKFLVELKSTDFELSASTLAQLFEFFSTNNDVENAKDCYRQLNDKYPEFALNSFKIICMAHALVNADKYDEAVEFLKNNKSASSSAVDSFMHNSKCWQMLNHLAEAKDDVKVKELTEVLLSNNYIEPSNVILGPSIKVHILKDDFEGALAEFDNCCKKYRSTPWKGELMKTLIMKEDATKLQWVADLSTQIHGEVNILHDLVLAFVECGRLRQARRILETPGMHTRQRRLEDACQRYVNEGQSEHLEGLLEATRELSHIDRSNIFYHLLVTYCNTNDTDKALGLWTLLQEQGEIPSEQFLATLAKHLKSKNIEVPFIVPETQTPEKKEQQRSAASKTTKTPTEAGKKGISENIESLVLEGKASEAMDLALQSIENGKMPKSNVLKFTLKNLALEGNVEKIQQLGKYIDENMKRQVTYDDKLTMAIFKRGAGPQHVDNLYESVKAASNDQDMEMALKKFPRSHALSSIMDKQDILNKCQEIAELAASRGQTNPANLLWMEYLLIGRENEANALWEKALKDSNSIVFRRLLQESFTSKNPELIHKLINILKTNKNTTQGCLGNAYGRLISYYMTVENDIQKAITVINEAKASGLSREHFNNKILEKFSASVQSSGLKLEF